jgi:hypothetical protein
MGIHPRRRLSPETEYLRSHRGVLERSRSGVHQDFAPAPPTRQAPMAVLGIEGTGAPTSTSTGTKRASLSRWASWTPRPCP